MLLLRFALILALLFQEISALALPVETGPRDDLSLERRAKTKPAAPKKKTKSPLKTVKQGKVTKPKAKTTAKTKAKTKAKTAKTGASASTSSTSDTCPLGGKPPCVCGGKIGLRSTVNCKLPDGKFDFVNPTDPKDGAMTKTAPAASKGKGSGLECVELQFIDSQMKSTSAMCKHFIAEGKNGPDMKKFRSFINNGSDKIVLANKQVNDAKGKCLRNSKVQLGNGKAAAGVASYVGQIKSDAEKVAQKIKEKMDEIGKGKFKPGFKATFAKDYAKALDGVITCANDNAKRLNP
ncbi:hypothetical protein V5O48_006303 [Marasmius crinis-equi]|uniref:Uncharacterized protein n=1 Tax=Marasmius crinis-equi TaxID=585013 RepID=A0ABR3FJV5_9AGAR